MNARELDACADRLEEFLVTMLASVGRSERRHHGWLYVQGLLLDGERKSIEPLAESVPLDWALYLPQAWTEDAERCRKAGVPESTPFRTKIALALELIDHLLAW